MLPPRWWDAMMLSSEYFGLQLPFTSPSVHSAEVGKQCLHSRAPSTVGTDRGRAG